MYHPTVCSLVLPSSTFKEQTCEGGQAFMTILSQLKGFCILRLEFFVDK